MATTATEELTKVTHCKGEWQSFAVVGEKGGINFWLEKSKVESSHPQAAFFGGIEIHYRNAPDYMKGEPSNETCWLLHAPCWHDGSSLQASEIYIPIWRECVEARDFDALWNALETRYRESF